MINYEWHLHNVDIRYLPDTQEAQLIEIHWGCRATDTDTDETVSGAGSINVEDENYIYPAATVKTVTRSQIFQFLNNKLGDERAEIEANFAQQLAARSLKDSFVPTD